MVSKTQNEQDRLKGDQESLSSVEVWLNQLDHISFCLRLFGLMAFIFTAANFVSLIVDIFLHPLFSGHAYILLMNLLSLTFTILSAIAIVVFEMQRKEGDALFEEISDGLQVEIFRIDLKRITGDVLPEERPELDAKIILRSFAKTADLPLIPGKFGPTVYIATNLIILCLQLWLYR